MYKRVGILSIDAVLPKIQDREIKTAIFYGYTVKINTHRLVTFSRSTVCAHCGLVATHFAIEKHYREPGRYHLNFYGIKDGIEVLFTKDHIIPLCKGGPDRLSNLQTLCVECNGRKGNS